MLNVAAPAVAFPPRAFGLSLTPPTPKPFRILAIESSCDETACAIVEDGRRVLADQVATQIAIHRKYGGVVPELASRNHVVDIIPVIEDALAEAQLGWDDIDAIAATCGPGLVGALLVGLQTAKAIAWARDKPLIPVNHLAGHLHGVFLHRPEDPRPAGPSWPHIALAVSGGHTAIYRIQAPGQITLIANTRDDAAGEAFDKVARMLGLGYPGGPTIERLAKGGDPTAYRFKLPRFKAGNPIDFSFSGLKTAVLIQIQKMSALPQGDARRDLLASFQAAAVGQLVDRVRRAAADAGVHDVVLVGGVACNTALRETLAATLKEDGLHLHVPPRRWCTDNAAMIAGAAFADARDRRRHDPEDRRINAVGSWRVHA
ncbi:MAG: N6-L-threonylcarbamoyladenine synthase [Bradymonadia bacterium]